MIIKNIVVAKPIQSDDITQTLTWVQVDELTSRETVFKVKLELNLTDGNIMVRDAVFEMTFPTTKATKDSLESITATVYLTNRYRNTPTMWEGFIPLEVQNYSSDTKEFMSVLQDIVDEKFHKGKYQ